MAQFGSRRRVERSARLADGRDEGDVNGVRAELYAAREPHLDRPPVLGGFGMGRRAAVARHACPAPPLERSGTRALGRRDAVGHGAGRPQSHESGGWFAHRCLKTSEGST